MVDRKIIGFLENFILAAIVLVIVQTFLYEYAVCSGWSLGARNVLVVSGLVFDLIFSGEFTVRSIAAAKKGKVLRYWLYRRGWVDFLSSWPLLVLDSGPSVYLLFFGTFHESASAIGALNVLKVVKAIRVTRILRLVRIIKIFGKIHNAESPMAQHHTASISATAVFAIVLALMGFSFVTSGDMERRIRERQQHYYGLLSVLETPEGEVAGRGFDFLKNDPMVLRIDLDRQPVYSRAREADFASLYGVDDYARVNRGSVIVFVSLMDIHRDVSLNHIESFLLIIGVVLAIMLVYTRHFVQTISDPLHIMNRGFRKKDYNLQVSIREEFRHDEVFRVCDFYNNAYLPAKYKKAHVDDHRTQTGGLSLTDFTSFGGKDGR